jgi:hypothetical protein
LVVGSLRICVAEAGTAVKPYSTIGFDDIVADTWFKSRWCIPCTKCLGR